MNTYQPITSIKNAFDIATFHVKDGDLSQCWLAFGGLEHKKVLALVQGWLFGLEISDEATSCRVSASYLCCEHCCVLVWAPLMLHHSRHYNRNTLAGQVTSHWWWAGPQ